MAKLSKGTIAVLGEIASLLRGAVASSMKLINNLVYSGFRMAFKYNETAMAFSRQAGLTAKQAQAYTEVLTKRARDLGEKYGIAAEEVAKLEQNLAKATGRVIMLNEIEAERQIQINRTVGEETANMFSETIMRTMGGQFATVQGAVSKAYATAAKSGLDAAGMAAKVGQNLTMANRLTFRNGVNGLTKMVALSEKLGFNVSEVENAANKFMDIQDAIENSAKLSMLGGAAGGLGGNPLDMAYEANADPEAFAERFTKILGGLSYFDENTLSSKMNYMSRDVAKGIAEAMGISLDTAVGIAKKQAEIKYKNANFMPQLNSLAMDENGVVDETRKDFLLNRTQMVKDKNGKTKLTLNGKDLEYYQTNPKGKAELVEMMRIQNMSDEEIVREQAANVKSIADMFNGFITSINADFAKSVSENIPKITKFLGEVYNIVKPYFHSVADNMKKLLEELLTKENIEMIKGGITTLVGAVATMAKWITANKWRALGALLLPPILSSLGIIANLIAMRSLTGGGTPGGMVGRGAPAAGRSLNPFGVGGYKNAYVNAYKNARYAGKSVRAAKMAGVGAKLARGAGWGAIAGLGLDLANNALISNGAYERGSGMDTGMRMSSSALEGAALGAWLGSVIPGLGTLAGAGIGAGAGALISWLSNSDERAAKAKRDKEREDFLNGTSAPKLRRIDGEFDDGLDKGPIGGKPTSDNIAFAKNVKGIKEYIVHDNEMVVNPDQQRQFNAAIEAKPVGEDYFKLVVQNKTTTTNSNGNKITVNDINLKIGGSVKLDLGNASTDFDLIQKLASNRKFKTLMAEIISEELTNNINLKEVKNTPNIIGLPWLSTNTASKMTTST